MRSMPTRAVCPSAIWELADLWVATAVQEKAKALKKWADDYLADVARGLAVLDRDPREIAAERGDLLTGEMDADRHLEKYNGDRDKAFRWARLEKRRTLGGLLVKKVIVRLGKDRMRIFAAEVVVRIPISETETLSYGDQSLEYVEQARRAAGA
jgi:hypothetical protein